MKLVDLLVTGFVFYLVFTAANVVVSVFVGVTG
jgi:hypothetical protein